MHDLTKKMILLAGVTLALAAAQTRADPLSSDTVVVTMGPAQIDLADVDAVAAQMPAASRPGYFDDPQRIGKLLETLIERRVMVSKIRPALSGMEIDPDLMRADVERRLLARLQLEALVQEESYGMGFGLASTRQVILDRYQDPEQELSQLAREKGVHDAPLFERQLKLSFEESLLRAYRTEYLARELGSGYDGLAQERYLTNREEYRGPDEVWIDYVMVDVADDREAARILAEGFLSLAVDPMAVETIAVNPKARVERLRLVEGESPSKVAKAAFALTEPGQTSGLIEGPEAFHFVKLVDRRDGDVLPFEQVKESIVASLRGRLQSNAWQAHVNQFLQSPVEANEEAIRSLRTRYADPGGL